MTPYDVLGVTPDCDQDEIHRAYRELSKLYHPDRNPGDEVAAAHYQRVQDAYDAVGESDARASFDRTGEARKRRDADRELIGCVAHFLTPVLCEHPVMFTTPLERQDVLGKVAARIREERNRQDANLESLIRDESRLSRVVGRFTVDDSADNIYSEIVDAQLKAIREAIRDQRHRLDLLTRALEYVSRSKYRRDGDPADSGETLRRLTATATGTTSITFRVE